MWVLCFIYMGGNCFQTSNQALCCIQHVALYLERRLCFSFRKLGVIGHLLVFDLLVLCRFILRDGFFGEFGIADSLDRQ